MLRMSLHRLAIMQRGLPLLVPKRRAAQFSWSIKKFLTEIGSNGKEARYWLKVFQDRDSNFHNTFAVMSIDKHVFAEPEMLNVIGSAVAFLHQNDLKIVLIHGFEEERSEMIDKHGLFNQAQLLSDVLQKSGVSTRLFLNCSGILHGTGNQVMVDTTPLDWSLGGGFVPILSSVAELDGNKMVNVVPSKAATLVSNCLQPAKLIHLNATGGIRSIHGKVIGEITIPFTEGGHGFQPSNASMNMISLATEGLSHLPFTSSVVITSANSILKELFTHRGSGTIIRHREPIQVINNLDALDKDALIQLLQRTFKRHVNEDYVETLKDRFLKAYVTSSYSAAAIITQKESGCAVPYLDKFAVRKEHQGLGTGEVLWDAIRNDFDSLFWRSRPENRINPWYFGRAEGSWASKDYIIFWYGINDPQLSHTMIDAANGLSSTFLGPILADEDIDCRLSHHRK